MARRHVVLALALVLAGAVAPAAWGAARERQALRRTGVDPDATGRASLVARGSRGRFTVRTHRLDRRATFQVLVDGVPVGAMTTSGGGNGRARFRTRPHPGEQLLGVDPRGRMIAVRNAQGNDVLEGKMPDGSVDPNAVRCCLGDEADECAAVSAEECEAQDGIDMGPGSCLPDPCDDDGEDVRCCLPEGDEDGAECEGTTAAECSAEGGVNLGAGMCETNPCTPTPPPVEEIRCCLADPDAEHAEDDDAEDDDEGDDDGDAPECERETPAECTALGGVNLGPGSCEPDPCAGSPSGAFVDGATAGL